LYEPEAKGLKHIGCGLRPMGSERMVGFEVHPAMTSQQAAEKIALLK
jgi:hypothetical protein